MVDEVVRAVIDMVGRPQEVQYVLGWEAGERNLVFYGNAVRIAGRDHVWVQYVLMVMVTMLRRIRLDTNLENTKSMVCTPGFIW